jgi:hypothetical protein
MRVVPVGDAMPVILSNELAYVWPTLLPGLGCWAEPDRLMR